MKPPLFGLMAEFDAPENLIRAARQARAAGYLRMDAYSPFPVAGLEDALGLPRPVIPRIVLAAGVIGGVAGYFMQWFAMAVDYPLNIGGRPLHSWPAFIPITFELTVLCAALAALIGMLAGNRLPRPHHPVFNVPRFARASSDRFFLCIETSDPMFDRVATWTFLEGLGPRSVAEVDE